MNNSILIEGIPFGENESFTMKNCTFLQPEDGVSALNFMDVRIITSHKMIDEYNHQQTDYYKWCKRKTGKVQ